MSRPHYTTVGIPAGAALLSGVLAALAHPPADLSGLAWLALVPLLMVLKRVGPLAGGVISLLFGVVFYFQYLAWFITIDGVNAASHILAGLVCIWPFLFFGFAASFLYRRSPATAPLAVPALWVAGEFIHSHTGFMSLSLGILAYSQSGKAVSAILAPTTGALGVSFVIVLFNSGVVEALSLALTRMRGDMIARKTILNALCPLAGVLTVLALSMIWSRAGSMEDDLRTVRVAVVQGGKGGDPDEGDMMKAFSRYRQLSMQAAEKGVELLVWPETAVPGRIPFDGGLVKVLADVARASGAHLLVGSSGHDKFDRAGRQHGRFANSAFLFRPDGKIAGRYDKVRLVPFNEYLPFRGKFKWPGWIVSDNWKDSLPGEQLTLLPMGGGSLGVQICWENHFPEQFRKLSAMGADFVVSLNNESFVSSPAAHRQMLAVNAMRAAENGITVIRANTTGISGIIGPDGKVEKMVAGPRGEATGVAGYVAAQIRTAGRRTPYNRHGDTALFFLCALAAAPAAWNGFRTGRRKGP